MSLVGYAEGKMRSQCLDVDLLGVQTRYEWLQFGQKVFGKGMSVESWDFIVVIVMSVHIFIDVLQECS